MKKSLLLVPLFSIALAAPILMSFKENKTVVKADAYGEIVISPMFFYDYDQGQNAGSFEGADATYWEEHYSFNSLGSFFRGESNEGWTGDLVSNYWDQTRQYVYFTWSAQNNSDAVNLEFQYGGFSATLKNDTFVENTMMLHYFKIPDEQFATFNGASFQMRVILHDHATEGFGFNNFGYLHINQNREDVSDAMRYYLNHMDTDRREFACNRRKEVMNHYFSNGYLRDVFLDTVSNVNEDFESNELFTKHWYLDHNYDNNDGTERHIDNVISSSEYRPDDGTNMPFNKNDNGFFKGWYADGSGYIATDGAVYRFVSRPFVLSGTGLISIKMAGRSASLHVIETSTQEDLAWLDVRSFNDEGDWDLIATGFNAVTMVKHYFNLEKFVGKTIQLAIADVYDSGWAASYFDDLVTNYTSNVPFGVEEVAQTGNKGTNYAAYRDIYVNSTHIDNDPNGVKYKATKEEMPDIDTGVQKEAYDFLNYYFDTFRSNSANYSVCNVSSEGKTELLTRYEALSNDAQAIVDASTDFDRGLDTTGEWYTRRVNRSYTVGQSIAYIDARVGNTDPKITSLLGFKDQTTAQFTIIMIMIASVALIGFGVFMIMKHKRKENN